MPHNIERSAFHPGEYVGYARGPWRIQRSGGNAGERRGWKAHTLGCQTILYGRTLADIGRQLEARIGA